MTTSDLYDDGLRTPVPRSPDRRFEDEGEEGRKSSGGLESEEEEEEEEEEEADDDLIEEEMGGKRKGQSTAEKAGVILVS